MWKLKTIPATIILAFAMGALSVGCDGGPEEPTFSPQQQFPQQPPQQQQYPEQSPDQPQQQQFPQQSPQPQHPEHEQDAGEQGEQDPQQLW